MVVKDYYKILSCEPGTTQDVIKKNYRSLAFQFHPDKNPNDANALIQFNLIKEAYEVLSDPIKRMEYHNQKWLLQSKGVTQLETEAYTAEFILKETIEIEKYVSTADVYKLDKKQIEKQLLHLFSQQNELVITETTDNLLKETIYNKATNILTYLDSIQIQQIITPLSIIFFHKRNDLQKLLQTKINQEKIKKYTLPMVIIIAIAIMIMVFKAI
jgi:molecular chaperone DnaJ